jgi:hypothetical protein
MKKKRRRLCFGEVAAGEETEKNERISTPA